MSTDLQGHSSRVWQRYKGTLIGAGGHRERSTGVRLILIDGICRYKWTLADSVDRDAAGAIGPMGGQYQGHDGSLAMWGWAQSGFSVAEMRRLVFMHLWFLV